MMSDRYKRNLDLLIVSFIFVVAWSCVGADAVGPVGSEDGGSLWVHDNLFAWAVVPYDAKKRDPEERARMLEKLGFKSFAYDWREEHIPTFDAEIEALQRHGINLFAWWFPLEAEDPMAKKILEVFKRHRIHPQLWVVLPFHGFPKTPEEWAKVLPKGIQMPKTPEGFEQLSAKDRAEIQKVIKRLDEESSPKTPEEQKQRVNQDADRINALVKLAAPYGSKVDLYKFGGWFGMADSEVAIIERLKELGVTDVGIAYNFQHAREEDHDDTVNFPAVWRKIKPYVVAVAITGTHLGAFVYPSQGDRELQMMRTIQESGWKGPIGLMGEMGGDAAVTLENYITGLDWLSAELKQSGSGGPRPFPPAR